MTQRRRCLLLTLLLPSVAGMLLVLIVSARVGPGVTPDSVVYLAAAESLSADGRYRRHDGRPYIEFPPLFPSAIAVATLGRASPVTAARAANAAALTARAAATGEARPSVVAAIADGKRGGNSVYGWPSWRR